MAVYADGCRLVTRNTFGGFSEPAGYRGRLADDRARRSDDRRLLDQRRPQGHHRLGRRRVRQRRPDLTSSARAACAARTNQHALNCTDAPLAAGRRSSRACAATRSSCTNTATAASPERGKLLIRGSTLTVADCSAPAARITGGSAATGGWKSGDRDADHQRLRQRRHPPVRGLTSTAARVGGAPISGLLLLGPAGAVSRTAPGLSTLQARRSSPTAATR